MVLSENIQTFGVIFIFSVPNTKSYPTGAQQSSWFIRSITLLFKKITCGFVHLIMRYFPMQKLSTALLYIHFTKTHSPVVGGFVKWKPHFLLQWGKDTVFMPLIPFVLQMLETLFLYTRWLFRGYKMVLLYAMTVEPMTICNNIKIEWYPCF